MSDDKAIKITPIKDYCGIIALLISIDSIFLAFNSYKSTIETHNMSAKPNLIIERHADGQISIMKYGNGTAHIDDVTYYYHQHCIEDDRSLVLGSIGNVFKVILAPLADKIGTDIIAVDGSKLKNPLILRNCNQALDCA